MPSSQMNGKSGDGETELNACIKEYLEIKKFSETVRKYIEECKRHGVTLPDTKSKTVNTKLIAVQNDMIRKFHQGAFTEFFHLWDEHLSDEVKHDDEAKTLEFKLNVYFAVYPLLKPGMLNNSPGSQSPNSMLELGMANLKYYLETKGAELSQTTEFVHFFALPFISDPRSHPLLQEIFKDSWSISLQKLLEDFLTNGLQNSTRPRLLEIFLSGIREQGNRLSQKQTQQQIYESEKRAMTYNRKYQKIQSDYHNLINISADLIDALEQAVQGNPVDMEFLQTMCQRLFNNQLRQSVTTSVDIKRPGTAGNLLRQSINVSKVNEPASEFLQLTDLDFDKIKYVLTDADFEQRSLLLQALRWKLTRTAPSERDQVLNIYIKHDLLGCIHTGVHRRGVMALFKCEDFVVRQYAARLFNAFASLSKGRTYLSTNDELLRVLVDNLRTENKDVITIENVLGTLQKLSLRRQQQSAMIDEGVIEWLIKVLEFNDDLSDYNLEYAVALTMNLCLRNAGKKRCARQSRMVLKVLADLLGHDNTEIRPYVNGALYSILGISSIREEAKSMSMEDILRCFIKEGQADMNRQLEYIIKQLNSSDDTVDDLSDDEDDDDDDEDHDAMEADLDKAEILKPEAGRVQGDRLLLLQYTTSQDKRNKQFKHVQQAPFNRPVTPSQIRPISRRSVAPSDFEETGSESNSFSEQTELSEIGDQTQTSSFSEDPLLSAVAERPPSGHSKSRPRTGEKSYRTSEDSRPLSSHSNRSNGSRLSHHSSTSSGSLHKPTTPTERPHTRSGSRPSSRTGSRPSSGNGEPAGANLTPRPRSGSKTRSGRSTGSEHFQEAFTSKPRIPRTPDTRRSSVGMTLPPQPKYSDTLPSPRPNSGEKPRRK